MSKENILRFWWRNDFKPAVYELIHGWIPVIVGIIVFAFISSKIHWFLYNSNIALVRENHFFAFLGVVVIWVITLSIVVYIKDVLKRYRAAQKNDYP